MDQSINQTLQFITWRRADGEMKADVLSVFHTCPPLPFSHQTAGRGNPCPYLQYQTRLKGWTDRETEPCSTNPPTQSAATTKSPLRGAGSSTVQPQSELKPHWSTFELLNLLSLAQGHLRGVKDRGANSALTFCPLELILLSWLLSWPFSNV